MLGRFGEVNFALVRRHVLGTGPSPYSLILLGDDMYLFERKEYDPQQGTWRKLAPGDPGRPHR